MAVAAGAIFILVSGAAYIVTLLADPDDDAAYWIAALAGTVSALNVLFTLWLLRTAQQQFSLVREQAEEQHRLASEQLAQLKASHDAERIESRRSLAAMTSRLRLSEDSYLEAARTRLDQIAPRVSLKAIPEISAPKSVGDGPRHFEWATPPDDLNVLIEHGQPLRARFIFRLANWGGEPVQVYFSESWESGTPGIARSLLLEPNQVATPEFTLNLRAEQILNNAYPEANCSKITLNVRVLDLSGQVEDTIEWNWQPWPINLDEDGRILVDPHWKSKVALHGSRARRYVALEEHERARDAARLTGLASL